jgi:exosortase
METKIIVWLRAVTLFVLIILGCLHFKSALLSAMAIDFTKISATQLISFEWIVPFISFYALFARRDEISRAAALPSWTGFVMTCLFLVALSVSAQTNQAPLQLLSFAGVIIFVTHAFWGKEAAKLLWFPMGFLVFAVPVFFYLDCLKLLSESLSDMILRFGTSVEQTGFNYFRDLLGIKGLILKPTDPSSGIRSIFAMLAIAVTLAHFTVKTRQQRFAVFCYAIPITIVANMIRSLIICLIALKLDREWAITFYTHYSQYVTFLIALILFFKLANFLVYLSEKYRKPTAKEWLQNITEQETQVDVPKQNIVKSTAIICLIFIFAMAAFFFANTHKKSIKSEKTTSPVTSSTGGK